MPIEIIEFNNQIEKGVMNIKAAKRRGKNGISLVKKKKEDELKKAEFTVGRKLIDREIIETANCNSFKEEVSNAVSSINLATNLF